MPALDMARNPTKIQWWSQLGRRRSPDIYRPGVRRCADRPQSSLENDSSVVSWSYRSNFAIRPKRSR